MDKNILKSFIADNQEEVPKSKVIFRKCQAASLFYQNSTHRIVRWVQKP